MSRKIVDVREPESRTPIYLVIDGQRHYMTMERARLMERHLQAAIKSVDKYLQCAHEEPGKYYIDKRMVRCWRQGVFKIDGQFWCKAHAKKFGPLVERTPLYGGGE